jgi:hypothetical protein
MEDGKRAWIPCIVGTFSPFEARVRADCLVHLHIGRKGCSEKRPRPPNKLQVLSLCAACCGRFTPNVIRLWGVLCYQIGHNTPSEDP